jgi:methyl-accepting chemotaxis protein
LARTRFFQSDGLLGAQLTEKVSVSLQEIVTKVRQVDELASQVASSSKEQTQGVQQLNDTVRQMDKVTQDNAATAEETSGASEELNAQAKTLQETVIALLQLVEKPKQT